MVISFNLTLGFLVGSFCSFLGKSLTDSVRDNGEKLFGNFKIYDEKVYALVDRDGYLLVEDADLATFQALTEDGGFYLARDKNHVYSGNQIVPDLQPEAVRQIGNNYYTDGVSTYYLPPITEPIIQRDLVEEVFDSIWRQINLKEQSQNYQYLISPLKTGKENYQSLLNGLVVKNDKWAYYLGEQLPDADINHLKLLPEISDDEQHDSYRYLTDGHHVYYKNKLMTLTYHDNLYSIASVDFNHDFLIDGKDGSLYLEDQLLDDTHAPYQLVTTYSSRLNQILFTGTDGIYFYNFDTKKLERAGENPFKNSDYQEIAPLVFSNGQTILAIDTYEKRKSSNDSIGKMDYWATTINQLELSVVPDKLVKVADVFGGSSIWQNGDLFYYFDNLGSQLEMLDDYINQKTQEELSEKLVPVYQIANQETLTSLLEKDDVSVDEFVRNLIDNGKLIPVLSNPIVEARTHYNPATVTIKLESWFKLAFALFVIIAIFVLVFILLHYIYVKRNYN
ncbi:DKNYY domain-containing protein [Streptococcus zalophi]|uniref:DKNYY domain-containing protein n=1 Tax=Streptococcus zalophi TaxID=640031 RepID=UPI00215C9D3F|nr:DKNYY domain-containing protein [Streptococcus zalophi]MCR8967522.1 DKNYY domain-containing protein [Streptococcus zalophi]